MPFLGGLGTLVSPFATMASQVTSDFASGIMYPPPLPPPDPEPFEYLPPPAPVSIESTWGNTLHILATFTSFTALAAGAGVIMGLSAGACIGDRPKDEEEELSDDCASSLSPSLFDDADPDKDIKEAIIERI